MKSMRAFCLSLLVLVYGLPLPALAQEAPEIFSLPDGQVGVAYRVNIADVLRDTYHLKLETDARASLFRWALAQGEMPPGLIVRANGMIIGTPRATRAEPYRFQIKVLDLSLPRGEALGVDFSIEISAPRVRLAHISVPRLVLASGPTPAAPKGETEDNQPTRPRDRIGVSPQSPDGNRVVDSAGQSVPQSQPVRADSVYASMLRRNNDGEVPRRVASKSTTPCDPNAAPSPSSTPGQNPIVIDARSGTPTYETLRFKKNERARVIIDNKNPYLYTYKYTSTATDVKETALGTFLPLLGGIVSAEGFPSAAPKPGASPTASPSLNVANVNTEPPVDKCDGAKKAMNQLSADMDLAVGNASALSASLKDLKKASDALKKAQEAGRKELRDGNKTRGQLYCASKDFLENTKGIVDEDKLEAASKANDNLQNLAKGFAARIDLIASNFPKECLDAKFLLEAGLFASGLLAATTKNKEDVIDKIHSLIDDVEKQQDAVNNVLQNQHSFHEEHMEGDYEASKDVEIKLELTPVDKDVSAAGPYKVNLKFGGAPFFSLSGGLVFSPLRKLQFDRVQGFERDQQGNLVLVNGKPNLTTVVGLKETSPTRIAPAIFLHGRIKDLNNSIVDGLHVSLGITAKNDNKGTDPEFLLGPSLSMLERKMFFTFGAYAGRQQKLTGGLFEGFAVPSTVTDLPIQKNYRWSFGFALSYQLPVNAKK